VPISTTVRGPALPADEDARKDVEAVLRDAGVLHASKTS